MKTKIYTKTGDKGTTGYLGGRVSKSDLLISLLGELDELNANLGWCASRATSDYLGNLQYVQKQLFCLGAQVADRDAKMEICYPVKNWIQQLETEIDMWESELPELKNFILPGGSEIAAMVHLARTVCRRTERTAVAYLNQEQKEWGEELLAYLNRLSDWLFTLARWLNLKLQTNELAWVS